MDLLHAVRAGGSVFATELRPPRAELAGAEGMESVGAPRSVKHAWQLSALLRDRGNPLTLGGWANPHAASFVAATERLGISLPALFGVFFYRSANPRALAALQSFLPVPADGLARDFAAGATAEDVCARTIRALTDAGARHFYISNLPIGRAQSVLSAILGKVGVTA